MGWTSIWGASRKDIVEDVTKGSDYNGVIAKCLKKCYKGSSLWTLWEMIKKETGEKHNFICEFMLGKCGDDWGYKDVDESMGPSNESCPILYIRDSELVKADDTKRNYAFNWRKRVVEYNVRKANLKGQNPRWIKHPNIQYYLNTPLVDMDTKKYINTK